MPVQTFNNIELSDFQKAIVELGSQYDLVLLGGRGSGKSVGILHYLVARSQALGPLFNALVIRKTHQPLEDMKRELMKLLGMIYPPGKFKFNAHKGVFVMPDGGYIEFSQLDHYSDYDKFQGRSYTDAIIDEAGQWASPALLDQLLSNLRGPIGIQTRRHMLANPGGAGHGWLKTRYYKKDKSTQPFSEPETRRPTICLHSTYLDNPYIDQAGYRLALIASTGHDLELQRAYITGDWDINRGAYFGSVIGKRNIVPSFNYKIPWISGDWKIGLTIDYGTAAPSAILLVAQNSYASSLDGHFLPEGSMIVLDEEYTCLPGDYTKGIGQTIGQLADIIKGLCERWGLKPDSRYNVIDDAVYQNHGHGAGSIGQQLQKFGIKLRPGIKGERKPRMQALRTLLYNAKTKSEEPGLYFCENCTATIETFAVVQHKITGDREDIDSRGPDHAVDSLSFWVATHNPIMRGYCGPVRFADGTLWTAY